MNIPRFWRSIKSRYNLMATKCVKCGEIYFPPRRFCVKCRRQGTVEEMKLSGKGEIVTHTTIYTPPEGFEKQAPYIMAIVKLEEGPMVTTQLVDCEPGGIEIGMPVVSVFRKIREAGEGGLIHYGYKFKKEAQV